jgi:CRP-like cAMP-binding protein
MRDRAGREPTGPGSRSTSAGLPAASGSRVDRLALEACDLLRPYFERRRFATGALLWREGESAGLLVALDAGRVKVYRLLPSGRAVTVFLFGPGDVFGFLPFLDGEPYPAYAQALEDVEAHVMPRDRLVAAVREEPEVAIALLRLLGRRLREALARIESLSSPGVLPRVAGALLALLPGPEDPTAAARILRLPVTGGEFAAAIGVTPETLSRSLTKLEHSHVVHRLGHGRFQVLDLETLRQAAQGAVMP